MDDGGQYRMWYEAYDANWVTYFCEPPSQRTAWPGPSPIWGYLNIRAIEIIIFFSIMSDRRGLIRGCMARGFSSTPPRRPRLATRRYRRGFLPPIIRCIESRVCIRRMVFTGRVMPSRYAAILPTASLPASGTRPTTNIFCMAGPAAAMADPWVMP